MPKQKITMMDVKVTCIQNLTVPTAVPEGEEANAIGYARSTLQRIAKLEDFEESIKNALLLDSKVIVSDETN